MNRRQFVQASVLTGGGLLLTFHQSAAQMLTAGRPSNGGDHTKQVNDSAMGDLLSISADGRVRYQFIKHEMGQGVSTAMAMIIAEELCADWEKVSIDLPDTNMKKFQNDRNGGHDTGGSCTIIYQYDVLRKAGATARQMLIAAAAARWKVTPDACYAEGHQVINRNTRASLGFGALAGEASNFAPSPSESIGLKEERKFNLIGQSKSAKVIPDIVTGRATYGLDVKVAGMLIAVVERCPVFRGKIKSYDASEAMAVKGVRHIFTNQQVAGLQRETPFMPHDIREGVVVVADSFWAAQQARSKLRIVWDEGANGSKSSADFERLAALRAINKTSPTAFIGDADAGSNMAHVKRTIRASYVFPHQLHNCMEPLNCTAKVSNNKCEIWIGSQAPNLIVTELQRVFGFNDSDIIVHNHVSGGGFGRRYYPDMAIEAAFISRESGGAPVKMIWTREDDHLFNLAHLFQHMEYQASVDQQDQLYAWYEKEIRTYTWGAKYADPQLPFMAYEIPNIRYDFEQMIDDELVHSSAWRGVVGHGRFYSECFVDEVAAAMGKDPYTFRRELLRNKRDVQVGDIYPVSGSRTLRVLDLAVEKSGWLKMHSSSDTGGTKGMGMAVCPYGNSYVAVVAEVTVKDQQLRIDRMTVAVDCGLVINPSGVANQISGGIVWSLTALLYGGLPIVDGRAVYRNFHQNKLLRMRECPPIDVHFVETNDTRPWGVGEISSPMGVPAVLNAIYAATGRRIRKVPIDMKLFSSDGTTG
ncbi:molybdopterin cofactor-binding domain-containing protein [Chryseolinea sp. T2]|uniref:xanthine dehydrogenase family protein molybdopterin-binding subunit n=1 Tax=Chryseolinea sp. T2 TaxID=3129255 RepID=UPI003077CF0E